MCKGCAHHLCSYETVPLPSIRLSMKLCCAPTQDIAVVPFLVLLPLIENGDLMEPGQSTMSLLAALGPTALQVRAPAEP